MLDLSSNMASNRKMDGLGVSGMSILGGIDTKFGLPGLSRSKVIDENLVSGGHFGFHAPVTLCNGFSKSTSWIFERHGM